MPCTIIQHAPINLEWAESLMGLSLNIPNKWWRVFRDGSLNQGKNCCNNLGFVELILLWSQAWWWAWAHYAIRYDSVLLYADNEHPGFLWFCLPLCCPGNPENKIAQVQVPKKLGGWLTMTTPTCRMLPLTRRQLNSTTTTTTTRKMETTTTATTTTMMTMTTVSFTARLQQQRRGR